MILGVQMLTITFPGFAFAHYKFMGKQLLHFFIRLQ
jgi:ABC-type glycerol-3-phosphate transport system permease component